MSYPIRRCLAACILAALSLPTLAEESPAAAPAQATDLPVTVVTASKRDQPLSTVNGAVTVVSARTLRDHAVDDTAQLGKVLPGVQLQQSGSLLFPIVSVRGVTSAQDFYNPALTIYVDGVPQLPVFAYQSLLDVDRVELLKGPQGTLYGKSAEGGVLNVLTRVPDGVARGQVSAGVSSRGGYRSTMEGSGPLIDGLLFGSLALNAANAPGQLNNPATGRDHIGGYSTRAGHGRLRLAPDGAPWSVDLNVAAECSHASQDAYVPFDTPASHAAYVMPGFPASEATFRQRRCSQSESLTGTYDFDGWQLTAVAAWQGAHFSRSYPVGPYATAQPERWHQQVDELRLSTSGERMVDATFGLYRQAVRQSRSYSNVLFSPLQATALDTQSHNHATSTAAYADVTLHATQRLDLSVGARYSRDEADMRYAGQGLDFTSFSYVPFGGNGDERRTTALGKVSAGFAFNDAWRAYASIAQGYKPTGFNLAPSGPSDAEPYGTERSTTAEAGLRYTGQTVRASAAVFSTRARDVQLYISDEIGYQHLRNVGRTRATGFEFDAAWDVTQVLTVGVDGTRSRARFRQLAAGVCTDCDGNRVPFSPTRMLSARIEAHGDTAFGAVRGVLAARNQGAQYFDVANTLRQSAYTLVDASVTLTPTPSLDLMLYADNATNRHYRTYAFSGGVLGNFAQPGLERTVGVQATYRF